MAESYKEIADRAKARLAAVYEDNKEMIRAATDTVEVWGAAGVVGWVHGRNGYIPKRLGIPLDLGLTGITKLVAFMGWAGKYTADLHSLGNGFGAYYFGSMGAEIGQRQLKAAKNPDGTAQALGRPLTADEAQAKNADVRTIVAGGPDRRLPIGPLGRGQPQQQPVQQERRYW